jgi:hypothetical protein
VPGLSLSHSTEQWRVAPGQETDWQSANGAQQLPTEISFEGLVCNCNKEEVNDEQQETNLSIRYREISRRLRAFTP